MNSRTFHGPDMPTVLAEVRAALGEDAMIVHSTRRNVGGQNRVEVVASPGDRMGPLAARLRAASLRDRADARAPRVVALVGPTGVGKTTTAVKLALHADAFGGKRVGFLALDTYRVGALEQLQTYADIMGAPVEVAYQPEDVPAAMAALADCHVVIIDAPGRSPTGDSFVQWRALLTAARPDEVYLVLPAGVRPTVAAAHWAGYIGCGLTHLILTKLDEIADAAEAYDLMHVIDLPVRWVTNGQNVPGDLRRGGPNVLTVAAESAHLARARLVG